MDNNLRVVEGQVTKVQRLKQGVVIWSNRGDYKEEVPTQHYQIHIAGHVIEVLLNISQVTCGDEMTIYMTKNASSLDYLVIAVKKDHLLYLNPNLHDNSVSIAGLSKVKTWHCLSGLTIGVCTTALTLDFMSGVLTGFFWIAMTAALSGFKKYRRFIYDVDAYLTHLLLVLGLPKHVNLFYRKYRFNHQPAVIDLKILQ